MADCSKKKKRMMRGTARPNAQDKLQPKVINAYREERHDLDIFRELTFRFK
jgi:hypothetical protein